MSDPHGIIGIYRKGGCIMETGYKPYTIHELVQEIWEDNFSHFEFMDNMNGGDCDCNLHMTMDIIMKYWGE